MGRRYGSSLSDNAIEVAKIPARNGGTPSYIHSFGMTESFIVLVEQPLFLDVSSEPTTVGCGSVLGSSGTSGSDKVPLDKNNHRHYKWKQGEMVI